VGVGRVAEVDKVEVDGVEVGNVSVGIFCEATAIGSRGRGGSKTEKRGIHCKVEVEVTGGCSISIGYRWQVDLSHCLI
jgi:hypothetical protein